jgi:hypothetical protein
MDRRKARGSQAPHSRGRGVLDVLDVLDVRDVRGRLAVLLVLLAAGGPAAWAQGGTPAAAPAAPAAAAPAPMHAASRPAAAGARPASDLRVIEDDQVRIEETRLRGQLQRITVAPKGSTMRSYEINVGAGGRDPSQDKSGAGQRVWSVLRF